jgi:hypothetical protein
MATTRITITIEAELLNELRSRVGRGEVSGYIVEALRARLRKDPILELLDKLDEMYGPLTDEKVAEGERWFAEASERLSLTLEQRSESAESTA